MSPVDYVLVGHIAADILPDGKRVLGGTVGYAAAVALAFGLRVGVLTSAIPDEPLLEELPPHISLHVIPASATTTYENVYHTTGRVQTVRAVAEKIDAKNIPTDWLTSPLVHIAPIADEVNLDVVTAFASSKILLTPQGWMRRWGADGRVSFKRWFDVETLQRANLVILSEEDIQDALSLESDYAQLAQTLIITQGEKGGRYFIDGTLHTYPAVSAQTIDPTGAGDVFAAACLAAWHRTGDVHRAIALAAQVAAWSVGQSGILSSAPSPDWIQSHSE